MSSGLDDVVAADTVLSDVDGQAGRLVVRGRHVQDWVQSASFEELVHTLFEGFFADLPAPAALGHALGRARCQVFKLMGNTEGLAARPPIEAVRALITHVADGDDLATALQLVAAPAVFTAAMARLRQGQAAIAPDATLTHAADTLRMGGLPASAAQAQALQAYLITVADHGLNASTFAARVVASTHAGLGSAVLAAISALKGPLHGGAPGPVLDMLDAIGTADQAVPWIEAAMLRGERLMGFGHRIYRVRDPRADVLSAALKTLADAGGWTAQRMPLALATERAALHELQRKHPERALQTNVEFYTALLLDALGFERELFTCVFAMGRVAGWVAHAREQVQTGRLMRPQSRYIGPAPAMLAATVGAAGPSTSSAKTQARPQPTALPTP